MCQLTNLSVDVIYKYTYAKKYLDYFATKTKIPHPGTHHDDIMYYVLQMFGVLLQVIEKELQRHNNNNKLLLSAL